MSSIASQTQHEFVVDETNTATFMRASAPPILATNAGRWTYIPEVDGLRTVAVLSVVLFHLNRSLMPGGFVGVDIFFVISGYLISSILLADIDAGSFSLLKFWQHRIARIAPALFLILAVTLVAGAAIYSAQDFASLAANAAAAAVSAANIKLLFQGEYFKASPDAQPLLHCWTLAVEEQFYLLFPPLLLLLVRFIRRQLTLVLVLLAASFLLCIALTAIKPVFAFYLLPTRAWELLAGFALTLRQRRYGQPAGSRASAVGWTGMVLIAGSFLGISANQEFPGWIAAIPVIGSVLVLAAVGTATGVFSRLLAHPAAVFIGKRSYSLYLWHWPVFSFVDYALFQSPSPVRLGLKITITILGTMASYHLLEKPARQFLNRRRNRSAAFIGFAVAAASVLGLGIYIRMHDYLSASPGAIAYGGIEANSTGRRSVILVGDSQGAMYGTFLASIAHAYDYRLNVLSVAGGNELQGEDQTFWPEVQRYLAQRTAAHGMADVIVVAEAWSEKPLAANAPKLRRAIAAVAPYGRHILLLLQPPIAPADATREAIRAGAKAPFFEPAREAGQRIRASSAVMDLAAGNAIAVDVTPKLLMPHGGIRILGPDGRLTYADSYHLSDTGTKIAGQEIGPVLAHALAAPGNSRH